MPEGEVTSEEDPGEDQPEKGSAPESWRGEFASRRLPISVHSHTTGSARARRQKAVAVGSTSLRRMKMGAQAIPTALATRAARASPDSRPACVSLG